MRKWQRFMWQPTFRFSLFRFSSFATIRAASTGSSTSADSTNFFTGSFDFSTGITAFSGLINFSTFSASFGSFSEMIGSTVTGNSTLATVSIDSTVSSGFVVGGEFSLVFSSFLDSFSGLIFKCESNLEVCSFGKTAAFSMIDN